MGGADLGRQYLAAGLVDEIQVHLAPVLFGSGTPMFQPLDMGHVQHELVETIESPLAVHLATASSRTGDQMDDLDAHARALIDANLYMTLGTADADGIPWVSPVYFAADDYAEFYWESATDATHSRNIAQRPRVSVVIFDSQVPTYHARAVYLSATATELAGRDLDRGLGIYPGSATRGATTVALEDVTAPSRYRLYRATVTEASVLCPREPRQPCPLHSIAADHRTQVIPWRHAR
jgi:Pyridoxamine 5'-phosphate oxidase/RibD C-terminal domain